MGNGFNPTVKRTDQSIITDHTLSNPPLKSFMALTGACFEECKKVMTIIMIIAFSMMAIYSFHSILLGIHGRRVKFKGGGGKNPGGGGLQNIHFY
jgi:hypothetical protein